MPSILGLMEQREARARQDLESWTEVLEQAQAEVDAARERVERARGGREELVSVLAGESPVNTPVSVPLVVRWLPPWDQAAPARGMVSGRRCGGRVWARRCSAACIRRCFAAVVAASGPVNGVELTRAVGREAEIKNEVEKIRHRAYVLERRGRLVRAQEGRFMPAPGAVGRGVSPASAERLRPGAGTA